MLGLNFAAPSSPKLGSASLRPGLFRAISQAILGCLIAAIPAAAQQPAASGDSYVHHLMPVPSSVKFQPGRLAIDANFTVGATKFSDGRLQHAIDRAVLRLKRRTGLSLVDRLAAGTAPTFAVKVDGPGMAVQGLDEDESYSLTVGSSQAELDAATVVGAIRGLETFLQLVDSDNSVFFLPVAQIQDQPRFRWRGLMIDVARHFEPVDVIERNLDAMAGVKLNVFHWHLSDDQGFRIESRRFPKLQENGSDGLFYTQEQAREVIRYARDRGIRVVPEFDIPAHSSAWFAGYPQFAGLPGLYTVERKFGIFDNAFDPTREDTYKFLDRFVEEMADLFPDAYFHIGGDESNGKQWDANPAIQSFMKHHQMADNDALQAYFTQQVEQILTRHSKRTVGWDEIMSPDLPKNVVVQTWRGADSLDAGARLGFDGLLSAGYYLDAMETAAAHYAVDPLPQDSGLDPQQADHILGGEACAWAEMLTPENIDSRLWPRTAAIAERFWSPATVVDPHDMYRRLDVVSVQLEELGVRHLAGPSEMLRRLAATEHIEPLRTLLLYVEPTELSIREVENPFTQLTVLTRLEDIVIPDPVGRRRVEAAVQRFLLDNSGSTAELEAIFQEWNALPAAVKSMAQANPLMGDAQTLANELAQLAQIGHEALGYLAHGATPPAEWNERSAAVLAEAAKIVSPIRIAVLPAIQMLVDAASAKDAAPQPSH
jgi:hexosaminidase